MAITVEMRTQVAQLYTALFGRAPDLDGFNYWIGKLSDGATVASVAQTMYGTDPARAYYPTFLSNGEIIGRFYTNVLGRTADAGGLAFWTAKLDAGQTPGEVIAQMIATVATYNGTDPAGLVSQALFNNKVTVAQHYAEAGGTVSGAASILSTITSDPATVTAAIRAIDAGPDAPVFASATVNGATLVMTYTDAGLLDATHVPAASAFAVTVAGTARAVTNVAVDANAKTVTLTLATAVTNGQAVTVAYTDPTSANDVNAIQDSGGNDAATLSATAVTNNTPVAADTTPPVFASATVTGTSLVMTYTEDTTLDATHAPATSAFTVKASGSTVAVNAVAVDAAAKTVTLTLATAVVGGQVVTVAYADPTTGNDANAIQDAAGNDAATLAATAVTNDSGADATGPVFVSATIKGATLEMLYDETLQPFDIPGPGAFTVKVGGVAQTVNSVSVNAADRTVTLTLATPVVNGDVVTVAYTDPTTGNDANAIQDLLGNDAKTLAQTAVTNITADVTAPVFASAAVNGDTLVMTYTELNSLDAANVPAAGAFAVEVNGLARAVSSVSVNATAKTVTLKLASAVTNGQAVTVAYTDPTAGNDAKAIQDAAGNDAATLGITAVTNNTPDTTAPVFAGAAVNGTSLVMTYTELNQLDAVHVPSTGAFAVLVNSVADVVSNVSINASAHTVTLTLATAVTNGQTVTLSYTDPSGANDANAIQDASGNDAVTLVGVPVTNNTP